MIVAEEALKRRQRDALLKRSTREGVTEHVRANRPADAGAVREGLQEALDRPRGVSDGIVKSEPVLEKWADACAHGKHASL